MSNNGRDGRDGRRVCTLNEGLCDDVDDGRGTDDDDDSDESDEVDEDVLVGPFSFNLFLYSNRLTFFLAGTGSVSCSTELVPWAGSESAGEADSSDGVVTVIESDLEPSSST